MMIRHNLRQDEVMQVACHPLVSLFMLQHLAHGVEGVMYVTQELLPAECTINVAKRTMITGASPSLMFVA
jgi:hypothetical protein